MVDGTLDQLRGRARAGLVGAAERAGARAHFRAMGIDPARLDGPIIGVASTWTGTMPCNLNQRDLADAVGAGVAEAGGVPLGFNTIAVSDNQSQGTPGMRASLISREVIADSIELMVHAHDFDGVVCVVGCDKTVPAAVMALARVDKPALLVYSGPMRAGRWRGREVTIQDVWEAVASEERGLMSRSELDELERAACPGAGTCAGHFTANTMAVAVDCLGLARIGEGLVPADEQGVRRELAAGAGADAVRLVEQGVTARRFLDKRALLNAMAGIAATGGSTNGVLHLLAIAREAGVPLTLEELTDDRCAHAGDREPRAVRPLDRGGLPPGRRGAHARPRARPRRARRRRGSDDRGRHAGRGDGGRPGARRRRGLHRSSGRSSRPDRCTRSAATSRPAGAS